MFLPSGVLRVQECLEYAILAEKPASHSSPEQISAPMCASQTREVPMPVIVFASSLALPSVTLSVVFLDIRGNQCNFGFR